MESENYWELSTGLFKNWFDTGVRWYLDTLTLVPPLRWNNNEKYMYIHFFEQKH